MSPIERAPVPSPGPQEESDGFLARWSRRKREAARAETAPLPAEPAPEPALGPSDTEAPETLSADELAALPRVDDLTESSDLTPFLGRGVPVDLKNAALRKIWMLTPAIRDHKDPAVDYAWDWNTPGGVPGDGCAPSAEATARMLRDLVSPRETRGEPETETVATQTPADDGSVDPISAAEAVEPASPAIATDPNQATSAGGVPATSDPHVAMAPTRSSGDILHADIGAPTAAPRKRHGGALPT